MFTNRPVAVSFIALMAAVSTAYGDLQTTSSEQTPQSNGTSSVTGGEPEATATQPSDNLASAMANFSVRTGLVVAPDADGQIVVQHVRAESDAARSGIKPGDILSRINGTEMRSMQAFQNYLRAHASRSAFNVGLSRGDHIINRPMGRQTSLLGMTVFPDAADRPIVDKVQEGSPAAKAGIRTGDVIIAIDHQTTDTMEKFMNFSIPFVRDLSEGQGIPFRLARDGSERRISIPRPKDSELPPLSPNEQRVLARQSGVLSTKTQEPVRRSPPVSERRQKTRISSSQQQNNVPQMAAQAQNPNQQGVVGGIGGIGGGLELGLDGLGAGGLGVPAPGMGTGTGTSANGTGLSNGTSVVAVLFGTAQNTTQNSTTSGQTGTPNNSRRGRNGFTNTGMVGFVTIQSTVPLSQSAANSLGTSSGNMGTNAGNTATGLNGTVGGVNGTATGGVNGTSTGVTGTATGTAAGTAGTATGTAGINGAGNVSGIGASQIGKGIPTTGSVINPQNPNAINIPQIGEGGVNPLTGNTGTGTAAQNQNANNGNNNNPTTVSAQVVGLPAGQYSLVVGQFGNCGDSAAVATGPVAADLGTIQVSANGQGVLQNAVAFPPQAFLGRTVSLVASTSLLVGPRSQQLNGTAATNTPPTGTLGCGVFRLANPGRAFTGGSPGGFQGNGPAGNGGSLGNGGTQGAGMPPVKRPLNFGPGAPASAAPPTPMQ
jgi:hypothetical protein